MSWHPFYEMEARGRGNPFLPPADFADVLDQIAADVLALTREPSTLAREARAHIAEIIQGEADLTRREAERGPHI